MEQANGGFIRDYVAYDEIRQFLLEAPDRYDEIVNLYDKCGLYVHKAEACLKVAKLLACLWSCRDVADVCQNLIYGRIPNPHAPFPAGQETRANFERLKQIRPVFSSPAKSSVTRSDISSWLMRGFVYAYTDVYPVDQVRSGYERYYIVPGTF